MTSYMDYTSANTQFTYDLSNNPFFKKDDRNYINLLSTKQLNTLENSSLLDIFLSKGNVVEPHYHQNAAELVYLISGALIVSIINPFTNELLDFPIQPGQVANVPQGWWHYEVATEDNTHLLAIFDAPTPEVILGSDILRLTPTNVMAYTYCLNEAKLKDTLAPLNKTVFIGPPRDCNAHVQPTQVQAAHVQPKQAQPTQVQAAHVQPKQAQPTQVQAAHVQPKQAQPTQVQPVHAQQVNPGKATPSPYNPSSVHPNPIPYSQAGHNPIIPIQGYAQYPRQHDYYRQFQQPFYRSY